MVCYWLPPRINPLVQAGIVVLPTVPRDDAVPIITLAISIRSDDLPKTRPSLATARAADAIEAAYLGGIAPSRLGEALPFPFDAMGAGEAALTGADITANGVASLPSSAKSAGLAHSPRTTPDKPTKSASEDFDAMRRRTFETGR